MTKARRAWRINGLRVLFLLLCIIMVVRALGLDTIALGASPYHFRGYGSENITSNTFTFSPGTSQSGSDIVMTDSDTGEAIGFVALDEDGHDISTSIDLGDLEIDFSTTVTTEEEGEGGLENDIPSIRIDFCETNYSHVISTVYLDKADNTVSGRSEERRGW